MSGNAFYNIPINMISKDYIMQAFSDAQTDDEDEMHLLEKAYEAYNWYIRLVALDENIRSVKNNDNLLDTMLNRAYKLDDNIAYNIEVHHLPMKQVHSAKCKLINKLVEYVAGCKQ